VALELNFWTPREEVWKDLHIADGNTKFIALTSEGGARRNVLALLGFAREYVSIEQLLPRAFHEATKVHCLNGSQPC